jgi:hypothetical protein
VLDFSQDPPILALIPNLYFCGEVLTEVVVVVACAFNALVAAVNKMNESNFFMF